MKQIYKLAFLLLALLLPATATAHDFEVDGIYYNILNDNEVEVTYREQLEYSYLDGYSGSVTIPSSVTYNGAIYSVTSIGTCAFYNCGGLTSISIPNSVTSIGGNAFHGTAWYDNQPDGLVYAGLVAYKYKGTMPEGTIITLREGTKGIASEAFVGWSTLTSIAIPNTVTSIGYHAFDGCSGLTSVSFPYSITTIGSFAFCGCTGLTSVTIPKSVTDICDGVFYGCSGLTSATIPNFVTSIGSSAFYGCSSLTSVTIPNSVTSIGNYAFAHCNRLNEVCSYISDPTSISIGSNVFYRNPANYDERTLHVPIGTSATYLADTKWSQYFGSIVEMEGDIISFADANVKAICIQNWDLNGNGELGVNEAAVVTDLGIVFKDNSLITSFDELQYFNGLESIGSNAFYGCSGLTSIEIPNSVTSIGGYAFRGCIDLTRIEIPNTVTSIGLGAFSYCSGLTSVDIPNSVTSIGDGAFSYCSCLTSVTIPNSVTYIGGYAFYNCTALNEVYSYIEDLSSISMGINIFSGDSGNSSSRTLFVPKGTLSDYQEETIWSQYFDLIVEMEETILISSIELNETSAEITVGETLQLAATVLPEDATDKTVRWASSDETVSTVNENGLVTAVGPGVATITAMTTDGSNLSASCVVTVVEDLSNYDNYLLIPDAEAFHGDTIVVPVKMFNEADVISFQTDIFLPEGLELLQEDGEYIIDPSERMTRTHSIMSNQLPDGSIRVLCYSSNYKPFTGNSGDDLFYLTVKVADDAEGDYTIQLKNTLLTNTDFVDMPAPDVAATVNVKAYILGDANNSGIVTVGDVVTTAQYVLLLNPQPFNFEAADVNFDGNITVGDVSRIAWMVLNPGAKAPHRAPALLNSGDRMSGEGISLMPGETRRVSLSLDNAMDYSAFQLDLSLPEGLTASNFQLTDRAGSHAFDVNTLGGGTIRALCYSPALTAISDHEGALLTFDVTATGHVTCDITVDGIELVTTACESVRLDGFAIDVNSTSGINEQITGKTVARVDYYNLAGQQVDHPEAGVTLVVTTYTDGTRTTKKLIK